LNFFFKEIAKNDTIFKIVDLNLAVICEMKNVSRDEIPDMPDRIIASTSLYLGLPLITRDNKIRSSCIKTVW
jgi:PIN domain nuclease of toxin-antitoxin system